jgi:hypothetical protein
VFAGHDDTRSFCDTSGNIESKSKCWWQFWK